MIITTSQNIEGKSVKEYLGIVRAATILVMPGGTKGIQRGWQAAVDEVNEIIKNQATELGADAVISVRYDAGAKMHLCATGTAVKL